MKAAHRNVRLNRLPDDAPQTRLVATIKRSSRFYCQAEFEPGSISLQLAFPVSVCEDVGGYVFVGGPGGFYKSEDLHLFAVAGASTLVALS